MAWQYAGSVLSFGIAWTLIAVGADASDMVTNPSFEEPLNVSKVKGWRADSRVYAVDPNVAHSGKASLRHANTDPGFYRLCSQTVKVHPGARCHFGVWVKTKDLQGAESGATICMEWRDPKDKWSSGCYPSGIKGTKDWTHVEETTRLPDEVGSVTVSCYVRRGVTGTAWFDDVELREVVAPPMEVVLRTPVYRGWITADGPQEARVGVRLRLRDHGLQATGVRVEARLRDSAGAILKAVIARPEEQSEGMVDLAVPVQGLPPASYDLEVRLATSEGKEIQAVHHSLLRVPNDRRPRCYIDEHRRLLVDGKPFFPLGMYFSTIKEQELKVYAEGKFNCLMPYGSPKQEQMALAGRYGLKVIYSIKDWYLGTSGCPKIIRNEADEEKMVRERVRQFRDHPALLAWYLNEELSLKYLLPLEAHQRWVAEEDVNHPTWSVLYQVHDVASYSKTFDVIGTDPYPIGHASASMVATWTAETFRHVGRSRPLWQVPQVHNWANYEKTVTKNSKNHTPTPDEVRCMAWQSICEGATGLVFFSWFDVQRNPDVPFATQWAGLKRIAEEIDRMAPVLLSIEPTPPILANQGPVTPTWLHWIARRHGGRLWIAAVNDGDGEGKVAFALPSQPRGILVAGENRTIRPNGHAFQDHFRPLAVHIYEIDSHPYGK